MKKSISIFTMIFIFLIIPKSSVIGGVNASKGMALIPAGEFMAGKLGSSKSMVLKAFYIDKYEVTQADYERVMGKNPSYFKGAMRPVEKATWYDAKEYCEKSSNRLPTEWEWEKAAKAGTITRYYWGDQMDDRFAWYRGNSGQETHSVGEKQPNAHGLYDMSGNVWEWTSSNHGNGGKVMRGGSWRNGAISQQSARRISSMPIFRYHYAGFRCVVSSN